MSSRGRRSLNIFGLSVLVALGMIAFAATSAQAAEWLLNKEGVKKTLTELGVGAGGESFWAEGGTAKLLVIGIEVECASVWAEGNIFKGGTALFSLKYLGCKIPLIFNCILENTEINATVSAQIVGTDYLKLSPDNAATFAEVSIKQVGGEEECLLIKPGVSLETLKITGNTVGLYASGSSALKFSSSIVMAAELEFLTTGLKLGSSKAILDGEIGKVWSVGFNAGTVEAMK